MESIDTDGDGRIDSIEFEGLQICSWPWVKARMSMEMRLFQMTKSA